MNVISMGGSPNVKTKNVRIRIEKILLGPYRMRLDLDFEYRC